MSYPCLGVMLGEKHARYAIFVSDDLWKTAYLFVGINFSRCFNGKQNLVQNSARNVIVQERATLLLFKGLNCR